MKVELSEAQADFLRDVLLPLWWKAPTDSVEEIILDDILEQLRGELTE